MKQDLATRLLDIIEHDIVPLTAKEVKKGNKIFGAAILLKKDLSLVIAETNNEIENPLWHGEMHAIKKLYERDHKELPDPKDCIFLATHEPCSLCLSAITWAGYDNFYYLFSYEQTRDNFAIPHDINILKQVYGNKDRPQKELYNRENEFFTAHSIAQMKEHLSKDDKEKFADRIKTISKLYDDLSKTYQAQKSENNIPLS
ncbi:MAG: nucleoside deaminase [Devosiaceae bacterium]|nr:nucleoside deaminase [Devosiaceae bacterium]